MNTRIAETVLQLYGARIRKIMDLVVNKDPRVRYAESFEGDYAGQAKIRLAAPLRRAPKRLMRHDRSLVNK